MSRHELYGLEMQIRKIRSDKKKGPGGVIRAQYSLLKNRVYLAEITAITS